ncbi:enoyl-ACP reductase FabI [Dongia sp.]|uniref:enoyl-ACP reductase FabI n=1 Tax=Dongia sp. TaxID=1977262 RepID=UPI0034A10F53
MLTLKDKIGLVVGIANDRSIAYGCARAFRAAGADLAITYLNDKARGHVAPLADEMAAEMFLPCDVEDPDQLDATFDAIGARYGKLDFLLHSIAYAPKVDLEGRLVDSSRDGFGRAMDISCHSFMRMARLAEPLMEKGGALLTVSYYGAEKVVDNYGLMGPVKAALECAAQYMASELGPRGIRVNVLSPGPIATRAASGIPGFSGLIDDTTRRGPTHHLAGVDDVGAMAAFLVSDLAANITGNITFIDSGYHVVA